jgi:hypothetical protein
MNSEQEQLGRDALVKLEWTNESILDFAKTICERQVKKDIAQGILPYLTGLQKELAQVGGEITDLIRHIEEFSA